MRKFLLGGVVLAATLVPAYATPTYYVYNLAAMGVANTDVSTGTSGYIDAQAFTTGNFNAVLNSPSQTPDSAVQNNPFLSSVPFSISDSSTANDAWSANAVHGGTSAAEADLNLAGQVYGPTQVFLMMNTFWGSTAGDVKVTLQFVGGSSQTFTLYGGSDIRDHNSAGTFPTTINNTLHSDPNGSSKVTVLQESHDFTTPDNVLHHIYRDVVTLYVDPTFVNSTLSNILIQDLGYGDRSGNDWTKASRSFVWGATVASVPEPSTWMMLASGLGILALRRRRK